MSGNISATVEVEDIFDAMNDDGGFALEFWEVFADRLHRGLLLDEGLDLIKARFDRMEKMTLINSLELMANVLRDHLEHEE